MLKNQLAAFYAAAQRLAFQHGLESLCVAPPERPSEFLRSCSTCAVVQQGGSHSKASAVSFLKHCWLNTVHALSSLLLLMQTKQDRAAYIVLL